MDVNAKARFIRISPRKVRLVVDVIRGMRAIDAATQLRFMKKAAARPVLKLLESAIANATNNFKLNSGELRIKSIVADSGPTLKRWMPRAFGRATPIRKHMSHISIVVSDEKEVKKAKKFEDVKKEADDMSSVKKNAEFEKSHIFETVTDNKPETNLAEDKSDVEEIITK